MYQNDCTSTTSFKSHNNSDNYEYYVYDESVGNENKDDDDEDDIDEEQSFNADKGRNCEDIDEEQEFKDFSKEKSIVSRQDHVFLALPVVVVFVTTRLYTTIQRNTWLTGLLEKDGISTCYSFFRTLLSLKMPA
ncbi:hypothetical protein BDC45DRAFT_530916 [Circinella umbellata]|nr:hypothetical protein BDC45DRAFT_530916 [Circinella umbellata]